MSYDKRAVAIIQAMERIIQRAGAHEPVRRCNSILDAMELMVEDDNPPTHPEVLRLLGEALLVQATVAGVDRPQLSAGLEKLIAHVSAR